MREWLGSFLHDRLFGLVGIIATAMLGFLSRKLKSKGVEMLEGKEVDVALGSFGNVSLDVNEKLEVVVAVTAKIDILAELHKLAEKSGNKLDDAVVAALEGLLGKKV